VRDLVAGVLVAVEKADSVGWLVEVQHSYGVWVTYFVPRLISNIPSLAIMFRCAPAKRSRVPVNGIVAPS
jgi:hypothetical protein